MTKFLIFILVCVGVIILGIVIWYFKYYNQNYDTKTIPSTFEEDWIKDFYNNHKKTCKKQIENLKYLIPENGICFDIGSNMGMFSEALLNERPNCIIHLFEPVQKYYNISTKKFKKFKNFKNLFINNMGLSNKSENKEIFIDTDKNTRNAGWNTYIKEETQKNMSKETTKLITLDSYCDKNKINKIDFIKIDTEGFEAYVLDGFWKTLNALEKKPPMLIELGWGINHPNWDFSRKVFKKLISLGYKSGRNLETLTGTTDVLFQFDK
tara:strand:+ start:1834 stop:2631 length:798 start_codon:yes stop_codon:yes gene_type:complete